MESIPAAVVILASDVNKFLMSMYERTACRHDPEEKIDLFKVCKKIQEQDPCNLQACRYKIESVTAVVIGM
jgi:hypothetical protein